MNEVKRHRSEQEHLPSIPSTSKCIAHGHGNHSISRRGVGSHTEEREGGSAGCLINRVVVMDFYLGNNNEVKFGRFPIPKVRQLRPGPTISIGVVGERSQLKCLSHFVAYKLLLLSPRSRLGYPPAPTTPPPPPRPAVITCSRSRQLMYF